MKTAVLQSAKVQQTHPSLLWTGAALSTQSTSSSASRVGRRTARRERWGPAAPSRALAATCGDSSCQNSAGRRRSSAVTHTLRTHRQWLRLALRRPQDDVEPPWRRCGRPGGLWRIHESGTARGGECQPSQGPLRSRQTRRRAPLRHQCGPHLAGRPQSGSHGPPSGAPRGVSSTLRLITSPGERCLHGRRTQRVSTRHGRNCYSFRSRVLACARRTGCRSKGSKQGPEVVGPVRCAPASRQPPRERAPPEAILSIRSRVVRARIIRRVAQADWTQPVFSFLRNRV